MNKHRFRLIFSKTLGFLIPVAEINNSQRKPGQTNGPSIAAAETQSIDWTLKPLPGVIRCLHQAVVRVVLRGAIGPIVAITCVPGMAAADMIVDPSAAPEQRATLNQAPNGVPVIEIANPNASGLSHNRFQQFDVQKPGVIFNNSTKDGASQIGGFIPKNTNLSQQAKAILTEVTGNNPSNLSGTLEVFGGKADLLIANTTIYFENDQATINAAGRLVNTLAGGAENVELEILNEDGLPVKLAEIKGQQNNSAATVGVTPDAATFNYFVQYHAVGAASAGDVRSSLTFLVESF